VTFGKDAVRWVGPERKQYRSSPPVLRGFCGRCGSLLTYEHEDWADEIGPYLGVFDDPARFPVRRHVHVGERIPWLDTVDHTPRYRTNSASGEPPVGVGPAAVV
jgi:hypothetical protein